MQFSKNFFICTTLLSSLGCLVLGYQLYTRTQAHKAQELLMVEVLDDCRNVIEQDCQSMNSEILKISEAYRSEYRHNGKQESDNTWQAYKDFIAGNISFIDIQQFNEKLTEGKLINTYKEVSQKAQGVYFPKQLDENQAFLYKYSELQKAIWKIRASMSTRLKTKFYYRHLADTDGLNTFSKRVVIQPRNLSPNPNEDFEADIFLAFSDPIPLDMRVYINDKKVKTNGLSAYFKAPRNVGKPQEIKVEVYPYMPETDNFLGAHYGRFVF